MGLIKKRRVKETIKYIVALAGDVTCSANHKHTT